MCHKHERRLASATGIAILRALDSPLLAVLASAAVALVGALVIARRQVEPLERLLRALQGAVASFRDGDFSFSITSARRDVIGELSRQHSELARTLREPRHRGAGRSAHSNSRCRSVSPARCRTRR